MYVCMYDCGRQEEPAIKHIFLPGLYQPGYHTALSEQMHNLSGPSKIVANVPPESKKLLIQPWERSQRQPNVVQTNS